MSMGMLDHLWKDTGSGWQGQSCFTAGIISLIQSNLKVLRH